MILPFLRKLLNIKITRNDEESKILGGLEEYFPGLIDKINRYEEKTRRKIKIPYIKKIYR